MFNLHTGIERGTVNIMVHEAGRHRVRTEPSVGASA